MILILLRFIMTKYKTQNYLLDQLNKAKNVIDDLVKENYEIKQLLLESLQKNVKINEKQF